MLISLRRRVAVVGADIPEVHRIAIRSLPSRLELVDAPKGADIVLVTGPVATRVQELELAVASGARVAVVDLPVGLPPELLQRMRAEATAAGVLLVPAAPHRFDPAWATARATVNSRSYPSLVRIAANLRRDEFSADVLDSGILLETVVSHDLGMIRDAVGPLERVDHVRRFGSGFEVVAQACGGALVDLVGVVTAIGGAWTFEAIERDRVVQVSFPRLYPTDVAAIALETSHAGARTAPPVHESGFRSLWRAMAAAADGGAQFEELRIQAEEDLAMLAGVLAVAG